MSKQKKVKKPDPTIPNPKAIEEGNWADKIFKELFKETLPTFLTEILHLPAGEYRPAYMELQKTIEKRTDFLGKLFANANSKLIAHVEVQNEDEKNMVYRKLVYFALILDRYKGWDLLQYVFFIGKNKPKMATSLTRNGLNFFFKLIWIKDIHYSEFMKTGKTELMLLAALANYGDKTAKEVMLEVVNEVKKLSKTTEDFEKRIEQLHILSNVHNLHQIFETVMTSISQFINVEKDPFYKKGVIKGMAEGELRGELRGELKSNVKIAINLILKSKHDDAFIADISTIPVENVTKFRSLITEFPDSYMKKIQALMFND
jgi:hypothetical protein